MKQIFSRNISDRKLSFTEYYGDGDGKGFASAKDTYHPIPVIKREFIGHIQKRVGNRLRKLKQEVSGLGGAGKLTYSMVDRLEITLGLPSEAMSVQCFSIVPHQKKTNSMIIVQKDVTVGVNTNKIFQIRRQHMFQGQFSQRVLFYMFELSEDALLEKCLHGKTQNQNESFNG